MNLFTCKLGKRGELFYCADILQLLLHYDFSIQLGKNQAVVQVMMKVNH
jgi:hypothetical protein